MGVPNGSPIERSPSRCRASVMKWHRVGMQLGSSSMVEDAQIVGAVCKVRLSMDSMWSIDVLDESGSSWLVRAALCMRYLVTWGGRVGCTL